MRNIIYYVATSLDGFIEGPNGDISGFVMESNGVQQYMDDLKKFDTVIMGRKTYEFGYQFGLKPGQPAYPHMQHHIFSNTLQFDNPHEKVKVHKPDLDMIKQLKTENGTDIYLCGGGVFAGWLLEHNLVDYLKIKLNPVILGKGTRLFGNSEKIVNMECIEVAEYSHGLNIITYKLSGSSSRQRQ